MNCVCLAVNSWFDIMQLSRDLVSQSKMATSMKNMFWCFTFMFLLILGNNIHCTSLVDLQLDNLESLISGGCVFIAVEPVSSHVESIFQELKNIFSADNVNIGKLDVDTFMWVPGKPIRWKNEDSLPAKANRNIAFFRKNVIDRKCLVKPSYKVWPRIEAYEGAETLEDLVPYINTVCGTFRNLDGKLTPAGQDRQAILNHLYQPSKAFSINMGQLYSTKNNPLNQSYVWHGSQFESESYCSSENCEEAEPMDNMYKHSTMASCDIIDSETSISPEAFVKDYVKKSRPVIFKGLAQKWPAFHKWTNEYLKSHYSDKQVHIKLTPSGDFEGVEQANIWDDFKTFKIPPRVKDQLQYPDLVVVRPAQSNMKFGEFIDLITETAQQKTKNISAYLEYSSIKDITEDLEKDIVEPHFAKDVLKKKHLNIWLSDGNTLGRLHFDPFDNLLGQVNCLSCTNRQRALRVHFMTKV